MGQAVLPHFTYKDKNNVESESMTLPTELLAQNMSGVFIETGSYDGRTIQQALDVGFPRVISIELSDKYYAMCEERFAGDGRVYLVPGDSAQVLPGILSNLQEPATFWLDAHIQEGVGNVVTPLLHELECIAKHHIKSHIIMIDDVRLMGSVWWHGMASKKEVETALRLINPAYVISYHDSKAAEQDIMVARL